MKIPIGPRILFTLACSVGLMGCDPAEDLDSEAALEPTDELLAGTEGDLELDLYGEPPEGADFTEAELEPAADELPAGTEVDLYEESLYSHDSHDDDCEYDCDYGCNFDCNFDCNHDCNYDCKYGKDKHKCEDKKHKCKQKKNKCKEKKHKCKEKKHKCKEKKHKCKEKEHKCKKKKHDCKGKNN